MSTSLLSASHREKEKDSNQKDASVLGNKITYILSSLQMADPTNT